MNIMEGGPVKQLNGGSVVLWRGWLCRVVCPSVDLNGKQMVLVERRDGWKDLAPLSKLRLVRVC